MAEQSPAVAPDFSTRDSGSTREAADCTGTAVFARQIGMHSDMVSIGIMDSRIGHTCNRLMDSTVSQFWVGQLDVPVGICPGSFKIAGAWVYYKAGCPCYSPSGSYWQCPSRCRSGTPTA